MACIPDRIGNFLFANVSFRQDNVKDFTYVRSSSILFFPSEVIELDWLLSCYIEDLWLYALFLVVCIKNKKAGMNSWIYLVTYQFSSIHIHIYCQQNDKQDRGSAQS